MNTRDISEAKDPDLRASMAAMQRAAKLARKIAMETNTEIVIMEDGKLTRIPAEVLRAEAEAEESPK